MTYKLPLPTTTNVKDAPFFAKGDGVTDDTGAVQSAVLVSNGITYFSSGTYKISSTLTITSDGTFRGEGAEYTTLLAATASMTMISPNGNGSFTFEDMTFDMANTAFLGFSANGIFFNDITFRRCNFIHVNNSYGIILEWGSRLLVEDCTFDGAGQNNGIGIGIVGGFDDATISNSIFRGLNNGIEIASQTTQISIDNVTVENCFFDGMYYSAPLLDGYSGYTGSGEQSLILLAPWSILLKILLSLVRSSQAP